VKELLFCGSPIVRPCILMHEQFLGAKKRLYKRLRWSVRPLVGRSIGPSVPTMQLRGKLVTSRLLREEEKEEETDYVAIPLRRNSFAPRD
jgi:hypothetical protein